MQVTLHPERAGRTVSICCTHELLLVLDDDGDDEDEDDQPEVTVYPRN